MLVTFQKSVLCVFSRGYILTVISRIICGVYSDKGLFVSWVCAHHSLCCYARGAFELFSQIRQNYHDET